ncbi:hypothetical protein ACFVW8_36020 [Streptomyces sp. NPDC058221]|uniref:hypothetical protein n=1 Tax=Streptomyces sp. NPDC058221 TaxID=3346388 RepID=UPI0036E6AD82
MGLPVIKSYDMPDSTALPRSRPFWSTDPGQAALLVHDMQSHFVRAFPAGHSPVVQLVENIAALRELAGTLGIPVVFSAEPAAQPPARRGLVADFSAEEHSMALRWAARSAMVRTTDGLLRDLLLGRVRHGA